MRVFIIFALLALAGFLWWWLRRKASELDLGLNMLDKAMIAVPVILAVVLTGFEVRWQWREHEATVMVREVSGVPTANVSCQRWSEAWTEVRSYKGWVYQGETTAHLLHSTCQELFSWLDGGGETSDLEHITAVQIVAHEAAHVAGEFNEAVAECQALRTLPGLLQTTRGLDEATAAAYTERYRLEVQPRLPPRYLNGTC